MTSPLLSVTNWIHTLHTTRLKGLETCLINVSFVFSRNAKTAVVMPQPVA